MEFVVERHLLTLLRRTYLYTELLRFLDLMLDWFSQTFPDIIWMISERQYPVYIQITLHEIGALSEYIMATGAQFQVFHPLPLSKVNSLIDKVVGTFLVCGEKGTVVGEWERN